MGWGEPERALRGPEGSQWVLGLWGGWERGCEGAAGELRAGQHGPGSQLSLRGHQVRGCPVPVPHSSQNHAGAISQSSH